MISYTLAGENEADVVSQYEKLRERYHPAGYGTSYDVKPYLNTATGQWLATVSRLSSCD